MHEDRAICSTQPPVALGPVAVAAERVAAALDEERRQVRRRDPR